VQGENETGGRCAEREVGSERAAALRALALEFEMEFAALSCTEDGERRDDEGGGRGEGGRGGLEEEEDQLTPAESIYRCLSSDGEERVLPVGGKGEEVACELLHEGEEGGEGWGEASLGITVKIPWATKSCEFDLEVHI